MPGGFPLGLDVCNGQNAGADTGTSYGTSLSASGTDNAKGAWTQLIAATAADACLALVLINGFCGEYVGSTAAVDIGIGASGSETAFINDLVVFDIGATNWGAAFLIPVSIPAGTRLSARYQSNDSADGTNLMVVSIILFDGAFTQMEGCGGVDTIGFNSSTTLGTELEPSATENVKGSYAQLTASTARDYIGLFGAFDVQDNLTPSFNYLVDIAIGPSGSEQVIIPDFSLTTYGTGSNGGSMWPQQIPFIPVAIPAGTRIAARCQDGLGDDVIGLTLYGVYQ